LGDCKSIVLDSLSGIWHCLRISALFVLCKLRSKYAFENKVRSFVTFCHMWREEVRMQLLAKGFLLIKHAKLLDSGGYFEFIVVIVSIRKRM